MPSPESRLFHAIVLAGLTLVAGACDETTPSNHALDPQDASVPHDGYVPDGGDAGWPPTK